MDHDASQVQYMWIAHVDLCSQQAGVHIELVPVDAPKAKVGSLHPSGGIHSLVNVDPKPCLVIPDEDPQEFVWTESYPRGMHLSEGA